MHPTDFCHPTNFERLHPCLSALEIFIRGKWRFTTRILASAESPGLRRGVFALTSSLANRASGTSLAFWSSVPRSQVGFGVSIEQRPLFPAFREECAVPNDRRCLPSVALELSSVCTIPGNARCVPGSLLRRRFAWRSFDDASALRPLHPRITRASRSPRPRPRMPPKRNERGASPSCDFPPISATRTDSRARSRAACPRPRGVVTPVRVMLFSACFRRA